MMCANLLANRGADLGIASRPAPEENMLNLFRLIAKRQLKGMIAFRHCASLHAV